MQNKIEKIENANMLKFYLQNFAVYYTNKEEKLFKQNGLKLQNQIIYANNLNTLRKAMCYILLNSQQVNFLFVMSNDIVEKMLNNDNESINAKCSYQDCIDCQLLIIYHPFAYKRNKILWETLDNLLNIREMYNKKTIILTDGKLSDDNGKLSYELPYINLYNDKAAINRNGAVVGGNYE